MFSDYFCCVCDIMKLSVLLVLLGKIILVMLSIKKYIKLKNYDKVWKFKNILYSLLVNKWLKNKMLIIVMGN